MPLFAHLPLILKPDGKGKLSKRDGDRMGFPVFPLEWKNPETGEIASGYRESGYFPEAFVNILAFLGWNPGTEQELFSMDELIESFSLDRVGKAGSRFDPDKARWFNHQYLQKADDKMLAKLYQEILNKKSYTVSDDFVLKIVKLIKERVTFINDFWDQSYFFFEAPAAYDPEFVKKRWKENTPEILKNLIPEISIIGDFTSDNLEKTVHTFLENNQLGMGQVMNALRLTIIGSGTGPGMFDVMALLGKEEVIKRIEKGIRTIK